MSYQPNYSGYGVPNQGSYSAAGGFVRLSNTDLWLVPSFSLLQQMPQAPGQYGGGSAYAPPHDEAHFRDGYVGNNLQPGYNPLIQSSQRPSYAPPPHAAGYGGYAPPPGPPPSMSGYAPPPGPPSMYGYAPPPGPPPPVNLQSYPGQQQAFGGQQQNVIYYFNTPIPAPGGPPTAQAGGYDANGDVGRLREAMRGIGTKEGLCKSISCFFW